MEEINAILLLMNGLNVFMEIKIISKAIIIRAIWLAI
jgi:hypothetical protein